MALRKNPGAGLLVTGVVVGLGVWGISKLVKGKKKRGPKKKRNGKKVIDEPKPGNYSEVTSPQTFSFVTADRVFKYEEGLNVRPAVLLAGPTKGYVQAKAELNPDVDFIWTTKHVIAETTPEAKISPLPVTIVWAFPIANILAGQWVKSSKSGSTAMNETEINTAIDLAKTGDVPAPPGVESEAEPA